MSDNELEKRIREANNQMIGDEPGVETQQPQVVPPAPVDLYQQNANKRIDEAKKSRPNGASAIVNMAAKRVVEGDGAEGLAHAYKKASDDCELLKSQGNKDRAEMRRQQYMEEYFLPAVEIVANASSPDELLNSKNALNELDKYAMLAGSGRGYTASYLRSAYKDQLGRLEGDSDAYIKSEVRKLNGLLDAGQIRLAVGIANKLKKQVEDGEHIASDADWDLVGRVVSFWG